MPMPNLSAARFAKPTTTMDDSSRECTANGAGNDREVRNAAVNLRRPDSCGYARRPIARERSQANVPLADVPGVPDHSPCTCKTAFTPP